MKTVSRRALMFCIFGLAAFSSRFTPAVAGEATNHPPVRVQHIAPKAAAPLVATNGVVVLDVRTPKEFADGHIAGATNIDFLAGDFAEKVAKLERGKTYLVHCASGRRSTNCLPQLQRLGFTNLIHLDGGIKAWQAAGNPAAKE